MPKPRIPFTLNVSNGSVRAADGARHIPVLHLPIGETINNDGSADERERAGNGSRGLSLSVRQDHHQPPIIIRRAIAPSTCHRRR